MEIILIILYLGWAIVNAGVAYEKNRNWIMVFLISLFLSPILPFLYLIAVPVKEN